MPLVYTTVALTFNVLIIFPRFGDSFDTRTRYGAEIGISYIFCAWTDTGKYVYGIWYTSCEAMLLYFLVYFERILWEVFW